MTSAAEEAAHRRGDVRFADFDASMLQTSVHGCDAPVADVTRVLRTCVPPA